MVFAMAPPGVITTIISVLISKLNWLKAVVESGRERRAGPSWSTCPPLRTRCTIFGRG